MSRSTLAVPSADPGAEYRALRRSIDAAVGRVLASGRYILDEEASLFEYEFARWLGVAHAVGCASGTDALTLALRAIDVGPGSAVATVSHAPVAVATAIELVGAMPILLDIEPEYFTMDPAELSTVLACPPPRSPAIRAVIVVHLHGQAADLGPILQACERHDVPVVEDCSQAHGTTWQSRKVGTLGSIAAFSLYPTKNLAAFGDAGVVATNHSRLAARLLSLRQYGWRERFHSEEVGMNSRLDELQAAILRAKLPYLDERNRRRREIASAYDVALCGSSFIPPARRTSTEHVFHQYVIRTPDRSSLQAHLHGKGIGTAVHSPVPVHRQRAYSGRVLLGPSDCRVTDRLASEVLGLPIFPDLTGAQINRVCSALHGLGARSRRS